MALTAPIPDRLPEKYDDDKLPQSYDDASINTPSDRDESDAHSTVAELNTRSGIALAASALGYFCTVGFMNAYGVFQQYYTAHYLQGTSNFKISWLGSFATFAIFAFAAPAGFLADRYGARMVVCTGAVFELVAIFMISLCREYYQFFLAQGLALGIGISLVVIPTSTIVPLYFKKNRGLAQGVSIGGSSLGGVLWPVALDQLLNHDKIGFGWSMRIIGFTMIPLLALTIWGLRLPIKQEPVKQDEESKSDGNTSETKPEKKRSLQKLRHPAYIFLCLGLALAYFGFFVPLFYIPTYAVHVGFSENLAFYTSSMFNGASLVGRILPGFVADRLGHFNILTVASFLSGIVCFVWTTATSVPGLTVWTIAYGFTSGAIMSLQLACATLLSDDDSRGAAVGIALGSVSLTGLFGPPIAGKLLESGYVALSCFSGAMLLAGACLIAVARLARERRLWVKA